MRWSVEGVVGVLAVYLLCAVWDGIAGGEGGYW